MTEIKLAWEPQNQVPLDLLEEKIKNQFFGKKGCVTIMGNGTLLFLDSGGDPIENAKKALTEAKFILDFRVAPFGDDGYLVVLHRAVAVYVGVAEYSNVKVEIGQRLSQLKFPSEESLIPSGWSEDDYHIGLFGRAKLQRDANYFNFYKRIEF